MAGRDLIRAYLPGQRYQPRKLQPGITRYAGNRSSALEVVLHEGTHNRALELFFEIDHVKWESEVLGNAARIVHVVKRAATGRLRLAAGTKPPALVHKRHRDPDNILAPALQQSRRNGTVHASAHCNCCSHLISF